MNKFVKNNEDKEIFEHITETKDLYYVALIILAMCERGKKYSNSAELAMILDKDNFLRLLDVYGGKTIYIPKKSDILKFVEAFTAYYYMDVQGKNRSSVIKELHIKDKDGFNKNLRYIREKLKYLRVPNE